MKKRILCFGDSNTWGYNGADSSRYPEDVRWTGRLQALLGEDYTIIEEAQNGRTTVWDDPIENRLAGLTYLWPCMESQSPFDLMILMLGTNDTKTYFSMTAGNIADAALRLVQIVQSSPFGRNGQPPQVLLVSPPPIDDHEKLTRMFGAQARAKSLAFPALFENAAKEAGCHFLDAALYAKPGDADGLHLDPESHATLAQAMYEKVLSILG